MTTAPPPAPYSPWETPVPAKRRGLSSNGLDGLDVVIPDRATAAGRGTGTSQDTGPTAPPRGKGNAPGTPRASSPVRQPRAERDSAGTTETDQDSPGTTGTEQTRTDQGSAGQTAGEPTQAAATPTAPTKPIKFSSYLDPEIADRLRNALFFLGGDWTTGALLEQALTRELDRLADDYNDGHPFPPRSSTRLRPGSRIRRD